MPDDAIAGTGNYFELVYADIATFGKAPIATPETLRSADIAVYGVPWDGTVSLRPGTRLGPRGIREQSQWFHEVWNPGEMPMVGFAPIGERELDSIAMVDCGDVTMHPTDKARTVASIRQVSRTVSEHSFALMLGGDHYVMYPSYQGVCDAHPDVVVGIVQIDAHSDLIDDDPVFGTDWSGTPIRRAMTHAGLEGSAVSQIALRGFRGERDRERSQAEGVHVFGMAEVHRDGPEAVVEQAMTSALQACDLVYLTVDIDGVDPAFAPGTGTPTPGGLTSHEFLSLLRQLGRWREIAAMDLVEVSPPLDPSGHTTVLAAHGLFNFIEQRFLRAPRSAINTTSDRGDQDS